MLPRRLVPPQRGKFNIMLDISAFAAFISKGDDSNMRTLVMCDHGHSLKGAR